MRRGPAKARAWARLTALALLWGSTFLWIEIALTALSPVQVTLSRCALGCATLLVLCGVTGSRLPRGAATWGHIVVSALLCNALPFAMFSLGQETVSSGVAGVLNATTPLWALLLGLAAGTERRIRPSRWCGLLLGFGGTVMIFAPWEETATAGWGALAIVVAAASYATAFSYMARHLVGRGLSTLSLAAAQLCAATGLVGLLVPAGGLSPVELDARVATAVLVLGVFSTGLTFYFSYRIIADEGATNAAAVTYLLPVVAIVLGSVVLGEPVSARMVTGMVIVLVGVGLSRHQPRRTPTTRNVARGPAPAGSGRRIVPERSETDA